MERKKTRKKNDKNSKYSNPCRKPGHDHKWEDCPVNWKNKKSSDKEKQKNKAQENNLILAGKKGFFSSSDEESSDDESVISQESHCMRPEKENFIELKSGEILFSIVRKGNSKNYKCLLDTGTTESMLSEKLADEKAIVKTEKKNSWETKAGNFLP